MPHQNDAAGLLDNRRRADIHRVQQARADAPSRARSSLSDHRGICLS
jgi:hypothetical protein